MDRLAWLGPWTQSRFPDEPSRVGELAVYSELEHFGCVRVQQVSTDDWGVTVHAEPVPLPGVAAIADNDRTSFALSAAWRHFNFGNDHWSAEYAAWNLRFGQDAIDLFAGKAAEAAAEDRLMTLQEASGVFYQIEEAGGKRHQAKPKP